MLKLLYLDKLFTMRNLIEIKDIQSNIHDIDFNDIFSITETDSWIDGVNIISVSYKVPPDSEGCETYAITTFESKASLHSRIESLKSK